MARFTVILLAALIGLVAIRCNNKHPTSSKSLQPVDFPKTVGSQWVYTRYDSTSAQTDTLTVTILDTITITATGELATVWDYDPLSPYIGVPFRQLYITATAGTVKPSSKDTTWVYHATDAIRPTFVYVTPLAVDSFWTCDSCISWSDSTHVESTTTVIVPAGTFEDAFEVKRSYSCGIECSSTYTYWVKPGIGIVRSHEVTWAGDGGGGWWETITTWELHSYQIR